jgi:hypothetical protein
MMTKKFFHLDCRPVIPQCGFQCMRCIEEILTVFRATPGVSEVTTGKHGEISGIIVHYDDQAISLTDLLNAFSKLPSFYTEHFIPVVLNDQA